MALFRTVMIGLICAGFTTVGYAVDNDDGVTGRYGDASGSKWDKSNPCTSKAGQTGVEHSGAIGDCKGPEGLTWTFKRCKNNLMRVIHADTRDLETAKLTVQNYCVKPKPCADGWDIVMAKVGNVHSVVFFPIFNSKGKPIDRERFCVIGKDFCNTTDAINAIEGAIAADMKVNSQAALQSQINGMTKEQLIAFFAQDFSQYAEYCCATKCRTPEYEEKPQGCKCVKKKADVKKNKIQYDCNGGETTSCSTCQPAEYVVGNITDAAQNCNPTREHYVFAGWYENSAPNNVRKKYTIPATESANPLVLHAKWQPESYKIDYVLGVGQGCQDNNPRSYEYGTGAVVGCAPTAGADYVFKGWCLGNDKCQTPVMEFKITPTDSGDKKLYAQWELQNKSKPKHKITYHCNADQATNCNTCTPTEYIEGTSIVVPFECSPSYEKHIFDGWCTDQAATQNCNKTYTVPADAKTDIDLYAKWQEDSTEWFDIVYHLDDDVTVCEDERTRPTKYEAKVGKQITCQPTRPGYAFLGWCEGSGECPDPKLSYTIDYNATGTKNMYAVWEPSTIIVDAKAVCGPTCAKATVFSKLQTITDKYFKGSSVWKNDEGNFNAARLASDSIAGVVLGTVGGVVTSTVMKKNQIKKGFEDMKCTINNQDVASYGDEFWVGMWQLP